MFRDLKYFQFWFLLNVKFSGPWKCLWCVVWLTSELYCTNINVFEDKLSRGSFGLFHEKAGATKFLDTVPIRIFCHCTNCTVHAVLYLLYCTVYAMLNKLYCTCCASQAVLHILYCTCCTVEAVLHKLFCTCWTLQAVLYIIKLLPAFII